MSVRMRKLRRGTWGAYERQEWAESDLLPKRTLRVLAKVGNACFSANSGCWGLARHFVKQLAMDSSCFRIASVRAHWIAG